MPNLSSPCLSLYLSLKLSPPKVFRASLRGQTRTTKIAASRSASLSVLTQLTQATLVLLQPARLRLSQNQWLVIGRLRHLRGSQDARRARFRHALMRTCPFTRWACAITVITSTAENLWQLSAPTPARGPSTRRESARAATSTTTTRCAEERKNF